MKRRTFSPSWILFVVGLLAAAGLFLVTGCRSGEQAARPASSTATAVPDTATPLLSPTSEPIAASVNGYTITQTYLTRTVELNEVLGELSGSSTLSKPETLQRLIRSRLILQGAEDIEEPTEEQVESFIAALQENWQVSDETLMQELEEVDLDRAFFEDTVRELLTVQAAVASLQEEGYNLAEWLMEQEQDADIMVVEDLFAVEESEATPAAQPTDQIAPATPTPGPESEVPDVAPSFTLNRAGGGEFTLADQLKEGPVVLVFFEKCG